MLETMLRSGVPPHIGQSPVPGLPADVCDEESADRRAERQEQAIRRATTSSSCS